MGGRVARREGLGQSRGSRGQSILETRSIAWPWQEQVLLATDKSVAARCEMRQKGMAIVEGRGWRLRESIVPPAWRRSLGYPSEFTQGRWYGLWGPRRIRKQQDGRHGKIRSKTEKRGKSSTVITRLEEPLHSKPIGAENLGASDVRVCIAKMQRCSDADQGRLGKYGICIMLSKPGNCIDSMILKNV